MIRKPSTHACIPCPGHHTGSGCLGQCLARSGAHSGQHTGQIRGAQRAVRWTWPPQSMLGQTRGTCPVCTSSHRWNVIISLHSWPANPAYILRIAPHAGPGYIWLPWGGPELPVRAGKAQHSHAHCSPGCGCPAGLRSRWAAGATGAPSRVRAARPMFCVPLVPARAVACVRACVSACAHVCGVCACVWTRARLLTPSPKVPALLCACPPCRRPAHVAWAPPWP